MLLEQLIQEQKIDNLFILIESSFDQRQQIVHIMKLIRRLDDEVRKTREIMGINKAKREAWYKRRAKLDKKLKQLRGK